MFWIILAAMTIVGGIVLAIKEREGILVGLGVLVALLVAFLGLSIFYIVGQCCITPDEAYDTTNTNICAVSDNTGTFFVGRYHADSSVFYSYIKETDDGGKVVGRINADTATLYDNEKEQPYITTIKKRNSNPFLRFFFFTDTTRYEIHIPPQSIKYDYNVDLK